jgi:hypothetical protein
VVSFSQKAPQVRTPADGLLLLLLWLLVLVLHRYREHYQLYEGKPCITDTAEECRKCLNARVGMIGKRMKQGAWGDPLNFLAPVAGVDVRALQQAQQLGAAGASPSS